MTQYWPNSRSAMSNTDQLEAALAKVAISRNADKFGYPSGTSPKLYADGLIQESTRNFTTRSLNGISNDSALRYTLNGFMPGSSRNDSVGESSNASTNGDIFDKNESNTMSETEEDDYGEYGDADFVDGVHDSFHSGGIDDLKCNDEPQPDPALQMEVPPVKPKLIKETARERARKASRDLKRELLDTSGGGRRSLKREHIMIKWILKVTHKDKDSRIDFADWIKDGQILTLVMTTLCFNSIENDPYGNAGSSPEETRIKQLRLQILDYGVDPKYVFQVDDVLHKRNTPKVIRCLEEVAKLAKKETHIKYDTLLNNKLYT